MTTATATKPATRPVPLYLRDGLPAERHELCGGTGNIATNRSGTNDRPCGCEDGLVPLRGLDAAVGICDDILARLSADGEPWIAAVVARVRAVKKQIEDVACVACWSDGTVPEMES